MSPGFHGGSLVTRQLGKLTHQILRVARAAPVVSMAPNLARGDIFMTVFTPTVTFAIGVLRNLPAIVTTILATADGHLPQDEG